MKASALFVRIWDLPTRLFHWALVAAVTGATVTGAVTLALESESPGELKTSPNTTHLARGGLTG